MAEINFGNNVKTIAFYLPQFHTIPENDEAWGKGFTEWTNVKKATPLFEGHYQPKIPLNMNYYCLLDEGVMEKQAALAKEYGIYGFCYYHYWFKNGKKLLEKPIEMMLKNKKIDIPFCLCWANENWSKRWDGGNNEIIVEQDYGDEDDLINHVNYLCEFFNDDRYIKIDNEPLLLIYKPELIPNLKKVVKIIRKTVKANHFKGVKLAVQFPTCFFNNAHLKYFDYYIQFEPVFIQTAIFDKNNSFLKKAIKSILLNMNTNSLLSKIGNKLLQTHHNRTEQKLSIRDYDDDWKEILSYKVDDKKLIAGAFTDWDNTARNKKGLLYVNGSPDKFKKYYSQLLKKVKNEYSSKLIFINAWNEWGEGAYLEPDEKYGYSYLEAIKEAINDE